MQLPIELISEREPLPKGEAMLNRILAPHAESTYAVLRLLAGVLIAFHGAQGLFGLFIPPEYKAVFLTQIWVGKIIELVAGLLVAVGLFTHWAAFLVSGTMAVAYIQFHWKFAFDSKFFPVVNQGELALVFCFLFLYFACKGTGKWGLDSLLKK
jgi:putative oxidoreductase